MPNLETYTTQLDAAIREWADLLGPSYVISQPSALDAAETATFQTSQRVSVILRPENLKQLTEVIHIAGQREVPLYPVSSGKNWGYGSRVPVVSGCALLDLSRMNQITGFSEALGYVTVQPGVTQADLFAFLQQRKSKLWMDATGSSPDCSLIGNTMERGFGHTPYGDHFSNVCGLEVVLGTGDVIRTGFAGLPQARAGHVYRWGLGPTLDGLFSQSNFGIVTEMTIWLMPAPEYFQAFFFQCDREDGLRGIIDALRPLRLDGTLRSAVHIANDYKVLAGIQQFPWGEPMPIPPDRMQVLRRQLKFTRWSGSGALYGTKRQVKEARRLLRAATRGSVDKLQFLDDRILSFAARFTGTYQKLTGLDLTRTLELVRPVYGLLKGTPTRQTLGSVYWRKRMPVPAHPDPDRDRCGVLWSAPVAPLDGGEASNLVRIAERILFEFGFEPQISMTLLTERSVACVISISYDREIPGEDSRAMACYSRLQSELERDGYYSYRLGIAAMERQRLQPAYHDLLRSLKNAVDPRGIIAPGRYVPATELSHER